MARLVLENKKKKELAAVIEAEGKNGLEKRQILAYNAYRAKAQELSAKKNVTDADRKALVEL